MLDFARSLGATPDARAVLYAFAAQWIRPSDTVVVIDPAGGAGSALLAAQSRAKQVISLDRCPCCTRYARAAYGGHRDLQILGHDERPGDRLPIADHLADVIVALDDDLQGLGAEPFSREVLRVLRPDGRVVVRAPHARLLESRRGSFLLEAFYDLSCNGSNPASISRRDLAEAPGPELLRDARDGMAVLGRDPLQGPVDLAYRHPHFEPCAWPGTHVTAFGGHYENPWIYRSLVQMGERVADEDELVALALRTMNASSFASPDTGAALTVIGYHLLSHRKFDQAADWLQVAGHYIDGQMDDVHSRRWQVSLRYCRALLAQAQDQRDDARQDFEQVARADVLPFSPLLATKVIAAAFWVGIIDLVDGRGDRAREWFLAGVRAARAALHADDANAIGNPECPLDFGFQELAEVADMASQCVAALRYMGLFARSPGQFWRLVDARRFGLASWAKNLEQENQQLRQSLAGREPVA